MYFVYFVGLYFFILVDSGYQIQKTHVHLNTDYDLHE